MEMVSMVCFALLKDNEQSIETNRFHGKYENKG